MKHRDVPRGLQSWVSIVQSVVLSSDVFHSYIYIIKYGRGYSFICSSSPSSNLTIFIVHACTLSFEKRSSQGGTGDGGRIYHIYIVTRMTYTYIYRLYMSLWQHTHPLVESSACLLSPVEMCVQRWTHLDRCLTFVCAQSHKTIEIFCPLEGELCFFPRFFVCRVTTHSMYVRKYKSILIYTCTQLGSYTWRTQ